MNRTVVLNAMVANWLERGRDGVRAAPREHCEALLDAALDTGAFEITGQTSDGFHTFDELYNYRMLYNAAFFNMCARSLESPGIGALFDVHKSYRHHDGEHPFGSSDWFIVMAELPTGQISNHYRINAGWDLFRIPERERAAEWDGHTPAEAAYRLESFLVDY
jgi:hypothetical protein